MATTSLPSQLTSTIRRITWLGFWVNVVLTAIKLWCGYWGHSDALVADGFHSLSDFATDFIVIIAVGMAYKGPDQEHPYGHGKFETMASLAIALVLLGVAVGIGWDGIASITAYLNGRELPRPDVWTIVVALISILAKEWLYRITAAKGRELNSSALIANAWHHRSDAISSIATLVGVGGAYLLGAEFRVLDPLTSILIGVFIAISALKIARPSIDELLERALPKSDVECIAAIIMAQDGVLGMHRLNTRRMGHSTIIDVHIKVDPDITVTTGHNIATNVERALTDHCGCDCIIYTHIEPFKS